MLAFDTNLAPIVGQQITLNAVERRRRRGARINLMLAQDDRDCSATWS